MGYNTSSASITKAQSTISSVVAAFNNPDGTGFGISSTGLSSNQVIKQYSVEIGVPSTESTNLSGASVTITNLYITDSSYNVLDDQAISTSGGYVKINGTGFQSGVVLYAGGTAALSTTFISATEIRAQLGAAASNTLHIYLVNPDNSVAIFLTGVVYSGTPSWITSETLPEQIANTFISIPLVATSDSAISYAVSNGSSLPSGLTLAANGVISGSITGITVLTIYSFGIDAIDSENQETIRTFSVTITLGDEYFNVASFLLTAAANTWIQDSSANSFPLTIAGDTKPSAFSPHNTSWSGFFDGTGDSINTASDTAFNAGAGDFTVEGWYYFNVLNVQGQEFFRFSGATTFNPYMMIWDTGNIYLRTAQTSGDIVTNFASGIKVGQWYHIALTRAGNTYTVYRDGVSIASGTSTAVVDQNKALFIGTGNLNGYISNFRFVKGTAVYTGNFTPPTAPLTAIANTSLLTLQDNRFVDRSNNAFAITKVNDTAIKSFSPFTETDLITGSSYFDGTGDHLTLANNSVFDQSGAWTIELWMYPMATASTYVYSQVTANFLQIALNASRVVQIDRSGVGVIITAAAALPLNAWSHVAVVSSGTTVKLYINGTQSGSTATYTPTAASATTTRIGAYQSDGSLAFTGYINDFRLVKGTEVYTTNFTPPTAPLTAITNTSLLSLQYRTGENSSRVIDSSGLKHIVTRVGDVAQGTFTPYSPAGWSAYFDNTGDYLSYASSTAFGFGTGDFTWEAWVYFNATGDNRIFDFGSNRLLYMGATTLVYYTTTARISSNALAAGQWYHVAVVRGSGVTKMYIDGIQNGISYTDTLDYSSSAALRIGGDSTAAQFMNGYISNARIVKGIAVYTGNNTPPTSVLTATQSSGTNIAAITGTETSALTLQDNRFVDRSSNAFAITKVGDTKTQAFSPFRPSAEYTPTLHSGSAYFDGTGDYLTVPDNASHEMGSNNFTIEGWIYPTSAAAQGIIINKVASSTVVGSFDLRLNTNGTIIFYISSASGGTWTNNYTTTLTAPVGVWTHVAVVRNTGGVFNVYINGVSSGVAFTSNITLVDEATTLNIGANGNGTSPFAGYISNLRIIKGTALYTEAFTPPTNSVPTTANTTLKLDFTNSGLIDATTRFNLGNVGTVSANTSVFKYGGSSLNFRTKTDAVPIYANPRLTSFGGNFTIEAWVHPTDAAVTDWGVLDARQGGGTAAAFVLGLGALASPVSGSRRMYYYNAGYIYGTETVLSNVWTHLAWVRVGSILTFYVNGVAGGTGNITGNPLIGAATTNPIWIGHKDNAGAGYGTTGYIDDLRITNGVARYTGNFTPPDKSLPNK